jgi:hypothetical protein
MATPMWQGRIREEINFSALHILESYSQAPTWEGILLKLGYSENEDQS